MNEIQTFDFDGSGIRTLTIDEEPYFVGKDVAQVLGYRDTADALKKHVDEEDKLTRQFADSGQRREMKIINESGLYSLILGSKLPEAKRFKRWVTSEVLPSLRRNGMYAMDELLDNPDLAINALQKLKEEREARRQLELQNAQMKPKALFAEAVETSSTSILIGDMAKLLRQNGVEVGQRRLFDWLRTNGWLMKTGESRNMPTQKAMEKGYFEIKERTIQNPDGSVRITKTTKVTGKGQVWLTNEFMGDRA
ncbi:phage antirepressor KilAC domain-containing protein [Faecalibaculum rodentium]|uniref:phage antirepressor KilAC domain-containing protein n=1 Tax=Faecalibaculum rodentium TaxID=1702221 RepID=UPI002586F255|nr:phage antirepressor KilAC domain-containing protein [Faecalibaculum rodentium]